jgi:PQQ-dependent catabolism-associated CXXCW motif protein
MTSAARASHVLAGLVVAVLALAMSAFAAVAGEAPPEPDGYRLDNYRAPTPDTLKGARTVTTEEAATLWRHKGAVFVDVMPRPPKPANLPAGTIWRDKPRFNIPGSAWLPDTGYGALAATTEAYFTTSLATLTGGDRARPLVIYCQRDCWMSWNAAKRAVAAGYRNVIWYPDGTDGWEIMNLPFESAEPYKKANSQ